MTVPDRAAYVHGHTEPVLRSHRWRTAENSAAYLLPHLHPGLQLLDVGSGPGTITADLARLVGPVYTTALERTEDALDLTRAELDRRGLSGVRLIAGDVTALELPAASFDVVHAHQVLQHVSDPVMALNEMLRVCRPGGLVAARDADYSSFAWSPPSSALDQWLETYQAVARAIGGEPGAGRFLRNWARQAGAAWVRPSSTTWLYSGQEARWWANLWADRISGSDSDLAKLARDLGLASSAHLEMLASGWRAWGEHPDAWFSMLHGEVLCGVPPERGR